MAFNGLLQGVMQGISAGAKGGAEVAKGYFEDQRKVDVYKEMADIETEKQKLIEECRSHLGVECKGKELEMEREETIKRGTDKNYLKSERNLAGAKHFESAASLAQARLAEIPSGSGRWAPPLSRGYMKAQMTASVWFRGTFLGSEAATGISRKRLPPSGNLLSNSDRSICRPSFR